MNTTDPASSMHQILKTTIVSIILLTSCLLSPAFSQLSVDTYIQQISKGWTTDAKTALPDLLIDRPDDPAVTFLHASLVEDPERAMPLFERIVQNHPQSEWADDALLRVILFSCTRKDEKKAKESFTRLRDVYPKSTLLPIAYDAMRMTVGVPPPTSMTKKEEPAKPVADKKPVDEKKPETKKPDKPAYKNPYTLNTKIVPSKAAADKMLKTFKDKRMRARVAEKWVSGKRNYVVQVGEYETEVDAARDLEVVRSICKCKPTVVRRD